MPDLNCPAPVQSSIDDQLIRIHGMLVRIIADFNEPVRKVPPEPTNAQGSEAGDDDTLLQEACVNCDDDELRNLTSDQIKYDANGDALCPKCDHRRVAWSQRAYDITNPPAQRFTAEEAPAIRNEVSRKPFTISECRHNASCHDLDVGRLLDEASEQSGGPALMQMAEAHSRTAATFRAYADMKERDDALERAATAVLDTFTDKGGEEFVDALSDLRSVLVQRAGKVE